MILYHFTRKENLESICKNGLIPAISNHTGAAALTHGIPVGWLTAKPWPAWRIVIPKEGELFMLTVNAKRGKHLIHWAPWYRELDVDCIDPDTGKVRRYYGEEMIAVLEAKSPVTPFCDDWATGMQDYYISTAVIHRKRIIGCAQVEFAITDKPEAA
jgi:hypothetical protein